MKSMINWFEIPVKNFERAKSFYSKVLDVTITDMPHDNFKYGVFPYDPNEGVSGALVEGEGFEPSQNGVIIYLNGGDDLAPALARAKEADATILMPKTSIGENGFMAHFIDSEGNRVALHSPN